MKRWYEKSVIYQIYPMSFKDSNHDGMGDINGILSKLDYLVELGVDILWLSPIYVSPMDDNGYDIADYYNINPMFGTMEDFKHLLKTAHQKNLKIIMDLVVNHTSDEHIWFKEAINQPDSPYRDYYIFKENVNNVPPTQQGSFFGGSAWELTPDQKHYYFHLFSKKQPDLNWKNEHLRQEIYAMINYWLDLGVDGFRMDVIDLIGKDIEKGIIGNGPKLHDYLNEMYHACFKGRKVVTVGETGGVTPEIAIQYTKEDSEELDMVFQFQHIALDQEARHDKWHLKKLDLKDLKRVLSKWQIALYQQGWNSLYWSNHDQPRIVSRWGDDGLYRVQSAKMFGALLHMMQGTPFVYQGEEIGMTNLKMHDLKDLRDVEAINMYQEKIKVWDESRVWEALNAKGRDNARTPMQWDDSIYGGFSDQKPWLNVNPNKDFINVKESTNDPKSIFSFYQKLIAFRKKCPTIVYGSYELIDEDHEQMFCYKRNYQNQEILVMANVSKELVKYPYDLSNYQLILSNDTSKNEDEFGPYEVRIYHKEG